MHKHTDILTHTKKADGRGVWIPFSSLRFSSLICSSMTNGMQRMQERDRQTDREGEREWLKEWVKVRGQGKSLSFLISYLFSKVFTSSPNVKTSQIFNPHNSHKHSWKTNTRYLILWPKMTTDASVLTQGVFFNTWWL